MKRLATAGVATLILVAAWSVGVRGADNCPGGWTLKFTARESELSVIILPDGYLFCARASTGYISGVLRGDGQTRLDAFLPEDEFWRIFGPPNSAAVTPRPTPRPTVQPTPSPTPRPTPGQTASRTPIPTPSLPDAAMPRD